jgi:hypothetical protein
VEISLGYARWSLPEVPAKQVEHLLKIAEYVDIMNRIDFFKPYNRELKRNISGLFKSVAEIEPEECAKTYYETLAKQVMNDTFYTVEPQWGDLEKNRINVLFLPNETLAMQKWLLSRFVPADDRRFLQQHRDPYQLLKDRYPGEDSDALKGKRKSNRLMSMVVFLKEEKETQQCLEWSRRFEIIQDSLPYVKKPDVSIRGYAPSIYVARLVYSTLPHTISLVYPPPELFYSRDSKTFKVIVFKDQVEAYVQCVLKPIAGRVLTGSLPMEVDTDSFMTNLVMQRFALHMGPVFDVRIAKQAAESFESDDDDVIRGETDTVDKQKRELLTMAQIMGQQFPLAEELKSRAIAIHNISTLLEEGLISKEHKIDIYATYLVTLLDRLRKKSDGQLNKAHIAQFNFLLRQGGIAFNINDRKLILQPGHFPQAAEEMAKIVLKNFSSLGTFFGEYGKTGPELDEILNRLTDIPKRIVVSNE